MPEARRLPGRTVARPPPFVAYAIVGDALMRNLHLVPPRQRIHPDHDCAWDQLPDDACTVSVQALPGLVIPGDEVDLLAVLCTDHHLRDVTLGLVLPIGGRVSSVTPPRGAVVDTVESQHRPVVMCRIPFLPAFHASGVNVTLLAPVRTGRLMVTAFAVPRDGAGPSRTAACTISVL
jgi:hypothetical protein